MFQFEYQSPCLFYIEGPLYREGHLPGTKQSFNSSVDLILSSKPSPDKPFLLFNQEIPKTTFLVHFILLQSEFENPTQQILNLRSQGQNLINIAFNQQDCPNIVVKFGRQELAFTASNLAVEIMRQSYLTLFLTNEQQKTEVTLLFNGQQRKQDLDSIQLSDFYRVLYEMTKVYVQIGTRKIEESFVGTFEGLIFKSIPFQDLAGQISEYNKLHQTQLQKQVDNYNNQQYDQQSQKAFQFQKVFSYPIDSLYRLATWVPGNDLGNKPIQPLRNVRRNLKKPLMMICHDMMGGYKEDAWTFGQHHSNHSYRFFHLLHCDVFIYFSHRLVTIPPASYINICHQYGVRVLGNLITEGEGGDQITEQLLNGHYMDKSTGQIEQKGELSYVEKLVQICKYYNFDGYLINIETKVKSPEKLIQFMKFLQMRLKEEVPDSLIVYYDSLNQQGELKWQSCLNDANYQYFEAADYFFTDYHWDLQKLKASSQFAGQNKKRVFTGLDVWGRGCYGGGQENCYLAIKAIKEHGTSLALFAPAWTYEKDGKETKSSFLLKDQSFWQGQTSIQLYDKKKPFQTVGTQREMEVRVGKSIMKKRWIRKLRCKMILCKFKRASFDFCIRSFTVAVRQVINKSLDQISGMVSFSLKIRGTGPKFNDFYVIILHLNSLKLCVIEFYNQQYQMVACIDSFRNSLQTTSFNLSQLNQASEKWVDLRLTIVLDQVDPSVRKDVYYIKFTEIGKDQEFWAGNFGTQFACENIVLMVNDPEKDLLRMISTRRLCELPIQTYFNDAVGNYCYIDGIKYAHYKGKYNILNDFDFMHCYPTKKLNQIKLINGEEIITSTSIEASLYEQEAWNGSSCLQIRGLLEGNQASIIKLFKTSFTPAGNISASLNIKNLDKNKNQISLIFRYGYRQLVKYDPVKITLNNGWDSVQFQVQTNEEVKGIYLMVKNLKSFQINFDILLGGFGIYDDKLADTIKNSVDFKDPSRYVKGIQLIESLSNIKNIERDIVLFDLYIVLEFGEVLKNMLKTVRIFNNKNWLTNSRSTYCYLSDIPFNQKEQDINIRLQIVLNNGHHMKVDSIKPIIFQRDQIKSF